MFYKQENNEDWLVGVIIHLPNGTILNPDNKQELDGWNWHDTPPQEYLEWVEQNSIKWQEK